MIIPHGGQLISRIFRDKEKEEVLARINELPKVFLDDELIKDVKNIARGVYSPLTGFLRQNDFESVVENMRLSDGTVWSIPIVLDITLDEKNRLNSSDAIVLVDEADKPIALMSEPEIYKNRKQFFSKGVFGTLDNNHPGVNEISRMEEYLLGGDVHLLDNGEDIFPEYNLSPEETRKLFDTKGWNSVVAFQTRNAPHRSHEFLQKMAMEQTDALFIQPVIGRKKKGDFQDQAIIDAYKIILDKYYPRKRTHLGILPLKMRYAGPREAIFHALIRKNYGCTHFIVGRDHAGVGDYYGPYDAHKIFDNFTESEIGIKILKFDNAFHCNECGGLVTADKCNHSGESRMLLSGTQIRQMIQNNEIIPDEFMRKEVVEYLINHPNPFVE